VTAPSEPVRGRRRPVFSTMGWGLAALAMAVGGVGARGYGQETVVIGGSGQPSVEIHLDALDALPAPPAPQRRLLMPGERRQEVGQIARPAGRNMTVAEGTVGETLRLDIAPAADAAAPEMMPAQEMAVAPPSAEEVPELESASGGAMAPMAEPEAAPQPVAEPAPAVAEPQPRQIAALPQVALPPGGGQVLRIEFSGAGTRLSPEAEESLRAVAAAVAASDGRLQLQAFAGGSSENASGARRASLSRALAVRSFLIETGVRSTRVDVRALGTAGDSGPAERVDVLYVAR